MSFSSRFPIMAALNLLVCAACGGPTGSGPPASQADADSAFVAALRARLEAATAAGEFSGAVLVARDGRTLFEGAYGLADRERGIPNTPLTQFRVGSMNKMLTAVAALQLVQAGTLRLDAPLGTYLGWNITDGGFHDGEHFTERSRALGARNTGAFAREDAQAATSCSAKARARRRTTGPRSCPRGRAPRPAGS